MLRPFKVVLLLVLLSVILEEATSTVVDDEPLFVSSFTEQLTDESEGFFCILLRTGLGLKEAPSLLLQEVKVLLFHLLLEMVVTGLVEVPLDEVMRLATVQLLGILLLLLRTEFASEDDDDDDVAMDSFELRMVFVAVIAQDEDVCSGLTSIVVDDPFPLFSEVSVAITAFFVEIELDDLLLETVVSLFVLL